MTFAEFETTLHKLQGRVLALGEREGRKGGWFVNVYLPPKVAHPKVGFAFPEFLGHAFGRDLSTALEGALKCTATHWLDRSRTINLATGVESTQRPASNEARYEDIV